MKIKTSVLQTELGNSEAVQKDFVRLSQSLQMELEKIRAADTAVRWQDDDDAENCPSCKSAFAVTRRKVRIFMFDCIIYVNVSYLQIATLSSLWHNLL